MASSAALYDLSTHRSGTTWVGFAVQPCDAAEVPLDLTGAAVRFVVLEACRTELAEWTLGNGLTYELADTEDLASPLVLKVHGPGVLTMAAGRHHYYLELTLADGEVWVAMEGALTVIEGVPA